MHQIGAAGHAVGGELSWEAVSSRELAEAKSAPKRIGARVQKFEFVSLNFSVCLDWWMHNVKIDAGWLY